MDLPRVSRIRPRRRSGRFVVWEGPTAKQFPSCWSSATRWWCCSWRALRATGLHVSYACPPGSCPQEDQNYFIVVVQAPPVRHFRTPRTGQAGGENSAERTRTSSGLSPFQASAFRGQLVELRIGFCSAQAHLDQRKERACGRGYRGARRPKLFRHSGRYRGGVRAAGDQRHRQLRRIPIRTAGPGHATLCRTSTTWRTRSWLPAGSARILPGCSPASRPTILSSWYRSIARKPKPLAVPHSPDHPGPGRLHGLGVCERLRLQQSLLPRLRAGRPALPHECTGPSPVLCALRHQRLVPLDNIVTLKETVRATGHQSLQSVPFSGNRWSSSSGLQLKRGIEGDGGIWPRNTCYKA